MRLHTNASGATNPGDLLVDSVWKNFTDPGTGSLVTAVRDATFAVGAGDSLGIIGPNGAGKSTVLKLVAGVTAPSNGRIVRTGHTVGVIELGAGVHFDLTGRENMILLSQLYRPQLSRRDQPLDAIIDFSGLGGVIDQPVRQYSTGMVARLAFSVAVHCAPDILLVDEVLSVGDLSFQEQCTDRVTQLRRSGVTVVVVSHDLALIEQVCARTLLLINGQIVQDGDSVAVIGSYLGQPQSLSSPGELGLAIGNPRLDVGEEMAVSFGMPADDAARFVRLEYVAPAPPGVEGLRSSVVFARSRIDAPDPGPTVMHLGTAGVPPERYEVHVTVEDASRADLASDHRQFTLTGESGPNAIRMSGSVSVDGVEVGSF